MTKGRGVTSCRTIRRARRPAPATPTALILDTHIITHARLLLLLPPHRSVLRVAKVLTYVSLPFWVLGFIMWGDGLGQYGNKATGRPPARLPALSSPARFTAILPRLHSTTFGSRRGSCCGRRQSSLAARSSAEAESPEADSRSMGSRPEANSYGYCTTVWLAALCEVQSVIIPAQLAFTVTGIYAVYFESSLHELPNLYLMYQVILNM